MAEQLKTNNEQHEKLLQTPEHHEALPTAAEAEPLRPGEKDPLKAVAEARSNVQESARSENQPNPLERLQAAEKAGQAAQPRHINRELKQITLRRELQQIRRKLPVADKVLSRVIHQPVVRVVSEAAGKTLSRPSGLLGGGLVALLGTSGYLYLAKHLGFSYNYVIFLLLFAGGFVIGLILELAVYLATASRRDTRD